VESRSFESAVLSPHAAAEITRRGIPGDHIHLALAAPQQVVPIRTGRVVIHHRYQIGEREYLLRIFVDTDREPPVVVTVYRTSKIEKYWRTP